MLDCIEIMMSVIRSEPRPAASFSWKSKLFIDKTSEAAQTIVRNVNYEVPAVKKQIAKCQQTQKECLRKENEYTSSASDLQKQYTQSCKQLGIKGEKIKTELAGLIKDLPNELHKFADSAKSLDQAVKFYDKFSTFLMGNSDLESQNVPLLKHLINNGNTTTFQWRTGRKPTQVEDQTVSIDLSDETEATIEEEADIDWGATDNIDFGDQIDFDLGDITIESGGVLATDGEVVLENPDIDTIDWGAVDDVVVTSSDVMNEQVGEEDVAKGKDALSILDNPETRNIFVDDLLELQSFLTQRLHELRHRSSGDSSHMASAPSDLHLGEADVEVMLSNVKDILDRLMAHQMQHLLLIRDSPRYVDRLRDSLRQKLSLADKMTLAKKEMVGLSQEAASEERELEPQLELQRKQTKAVKKQLEAEISKKYNDRKVNIIGEVNSL
ncbi:CDK5 regulatory subunit-associated protein 3 [Elysia marginata]|uniref:CDK5 regulatory subunit-associated protein 3 n=1 Tax=Elysia marginata TaxID=1093978 RepID=A0AAV4HR90_9GAST|nr:CDK5 regulatory subunit-associated protein 3 [Elysia marginata]